MGLLSPLTIGSFAEAYYSFGFFVTFVYVIFVQLIVILVTFPQDLGTSLFMRLGAIFDIVKINSLKL